MLPNHSWVKNLDDVVQEMVKKALQLLRRTVKSFFYVPWKHKGLGLLNIKNDQDFG